MKTKTKLVVFSSLAFSPIAQAITLAFGPTGGAPVLIPGTGGTTYSSVLISGGQSATGANGGNGGASGNHLGSSGTVTNLIGGTFDGTFFDPTVDPNNTFTTKIASAQARDLDEGLNNDFADYIGFTVSFSNPIELFAFGFLDLDGSTQFGQEWAASFALNGTTLVTPTVTAGDTSISVSSETVDFSDITNSPTTLDIALQNASPGNLDPDNAKSQVMFDYGGQFVTELHFLFGLQEDKGNASHSSNSGVTGFTVVDPEIVPEPSSTALLGLSGLAFMLRRKR